MNNQMIFTAELATSAVSLISFLTSVILFKRTKILARTLSYQESRVDQEMAAISGDLDTVSQKAGEYARRVAWLETRVRHTQVEPKPAAEPVAATTNAKPTITERRHRVLTLARRGQDPQTIARTLGMPHGEVELMINLGRAA
jgi:DNA-binding NarL/FixJ family response regulator